MITHTRTLKPRSPDEVFVIIGVHRLNELNIYVHTIYEIKGKIIFDYFFLFILIACNMRTPVILFSRRVYKICI